MNAGAESDVTPKVLEEIGFTAEQASRAKAFRGKVVLIVKTVVTKEEWEFMRF